MALLYGIRYSPMALKFNNTISRCLSYTSARSVSVSTPPKLTFNHVNQTFWKTSCRLLHGNVLSQSAKRDIRLLQRLYKMSISQQLLTAPLPRNWACAQSVRFASSGHRKNDTAIQSAILYVLALFIFMVGFAYAGVPLYKTFCQQFGLGGSTSFSRNFDEKQVYKMDKVEDREIKVNFSAHKTATMQWDFKPQQYSIKVIPGETALAFYTARNPTDKPVIGISTYSVLPYAAGKYFHKIQCFCFEEQILNPKEQVDMPVFFFIDPEYDNDPELEGIDDITLCYTFFEAKEGLNLPLPGFMTATPSQKSAA